MTPPDWLSFWIVIASIPTTLVVVLVAQLSADRLEERRRRRGPR